MLFEMQVLKNHSFVGKTRSPGLILHITAPAVSQLGDPLCSSHGGADCVLNIGSSLIAVDYKTIIGVCSNMDGVLLRPVAAAIISNVGKGTTT